MRLEKRTQIQARKALLRRRMRSLLRAMSEQERAQGSRLAAARLCGSPWWREAVWVLSYFPLAGELDTVPIMDAALRQGKGVALPRIAGGQLTFHVYRGGAAELIRGAYGILEPRPDRPLFKLGERGSGPLLVLAPGLAFDRCGRRLGRGKGYYDRFLAALREGSSAPVRAVGLCFSAQLLSALPAQPGDQPVDGVVTETELL